MKYRIFRADRRTFLARADDGDDKVIAEFFGAVTLGETGEILRALSAFAGDHHAFPLDGDMPGSIMGVKGRETRP